MQLTFATPNDKAAVMALYDLCFPGEHEYCVYYHDNFWKPDRCLLVKDGEKLIAMVNLMDAAMQGEDGLLDVTYIFAAATHPDYRGKGIMGNMLEFSFGMGEAEGKDLSILITENDSLFAFYKRFGYAPSFAVSELRPGQEPPFPMCKVRMLNETDIPKLEYLFKAATAGRLAIHRDAQRWKEILEEYNERAFGLFDQSGGNLLAFALMDERGVNAVEIIGIGADYLLWSCSMQPDQAVGRTLPRQDGEGNMPIGCALALSPRGEAELRDKAALLPYINILFN